MNCSNSRNIAVNADSLATWFKPLLLDLFAHHAVALEILTEDEGHAAERLHRGEVVGCISSDAKAAAGFVADPLGTMEYRCYASPAFAARFMQDGLNVAVALTAPAVLFNRKDGLHDRYLQEQLGVQLDRYPRHYLPSSAALLEGIAMGAGYGLAPTCQASRMLEAGLIQEVRPSMATRLPLFWHRWPSEPPLARQVTQLVLEHAHRQLEQAVDCQVTQAQRARRAFTRGRRLPRGPQPQRRSGVSSRQLQDGNSLASGDS